MTKTTCRFRVAILLPLVLGASAVEDDGRIVGGIDADDGAFPYQVSLRIRNHHFCGGSIIEDNWILTAAHCVEGKKPEDFTVVAGTNLLNAGGDSYKVQKLIPHESYQPLTISDDIALVKLQDHMAMKRAISKISLPDQDIEEGAELVLSGWGTTSYPGKPPNKLQTIKLKSISNDKCVHEHPDGLVKRGNLCTLTKAGEGACHGDSGGPLVSSGKQVGVVSWGIPCAKGKPDVFTRVYTYMDWIKKNMA